MVVTCRISPLFPPFISPSCRGTEGGGALRAVTSPKRGACDREGWGEGREGFSQGLGGGSVGGFSGQSHPTKRGAQERYGGGMSGGGGIRTSQGRSTSGRTDGLPPQFLNTRCESQRTSRLLCTQGGGEEVDETGPGRDRRDAARSSLAATQHNDTPHDDTLSVTHRRTSFPVRF